MTEIYRKYALRYDELVGAEDYEGNLRAVLRRAINWKNKTVYEAGIGTGRVTEMYIRRIRRLYGFDREQHMLDRCTRNLAAYSGRMILACADNYELQPAAEKADVFIEGWSFGHTVWEHRDNIDNAIARLIRNIDGTISPAGTAVIIESLGTNTEEVGAMNEALHCFYTALEDEYGFERNTIRTDYRFDSCRRAAKVLGFFFGDEMGKKVLQRGKRVVPEYTGVWIRRGKYAGGRVS